MQLSDTIDKRRSVREFSDKKVKWPDVLEAIDAAIKAPFAGNINNLRFLIIQDQEKLDFLAKNCQQEFVADASYVVIVCSDYKKLEMRFQDDAEMYARQQAGAAIQNFLLKITDLKLSSCWIGLFLEDKIKLEFNIPENWNIEALLPIGYQKTRRVKQKAPMRASLEKSIYWEKWGTRKKPTPIKNPRTW